MKFEAGTNIAIKTPKHLYDATVHFYRDVLLLDVEEQQTTHPTVLQSHKVLFGVCTLWLHCVDGIETSSLWLELETPDITTATRYLETNNIRTFDELAPIPDNMHWIKDHSGIVLLLKGR